MKCGKCEKEATIHLTEIINGQMHEVHLCEECVNKQGGEVKFSNFFGPEDDLGEGVLNLDALMGMGAEEKASSCPECGQTSREFEKSGRLGCSECYRSFSKTILPLVKRVQGATGHVGKKPSKLPGERRSVQDLRSLQNRLRKSIEKEEFEEAAKLRDQIKKMEKSPSRKKKDS